MTTICKLPEEVLRNVFEKAYIEDLRQCQKVCRTWYLPAHITLLSKEIILWEDVGIKKFIASIDYNSDKSYLNAVKCIRLKYGYSSEDPLIFEKLFFRFKNLEKIMVMDSLSLLEGFSDCNSLSTACPKLKVFEVAEACMYTTRYYEVLWKLRQVLTRLDIMDTRSFVKYGGTVKFISCFPRLKAIYGYPNQFDSFKKLLPVFQHSEDLTSISMAPTQAKKNFAERFLASKTKEIQDLIVKRLSQVLYLECRGHRHFCADSIKFIKKYLTGLKTFLFSSFVDEDWNEEQRQAFCDDLLDIVYSAKKAHICIQSMSIIDLSSCFSVIMKKVFHHATSARRVLEFHMVNLGNDGLADLTVESDGFAQKVMLGISFDLCLHDIISDVLDKTELISDVDDLVLAIDQRHDPYCDPDQEIDTGTYDAILKKIPSLKKVTLDIPITFSDLKNSTSVITYPSVEKVTLRATEGITIQKLLNRCFSAYPNLKQLDLQYFSGSSNSRLFGEFRVDLSGCTLEQLEIDITSMVRKRLIGNNFFIIVVDIGERHTYRVPVDLSSISAINDGELAGLTLGKDYFQMYISIDGLMRLEIYGIGDIKGQPRKHEYGHDYLDSQKSRRLGITFNSNNY